MASEAAPHRWKFMRAGGVEQVVIRSGADIVNLEHLDQKLWVALACPTRGIEFDTRTLDLVDTNHDGRVRAPELIEASRWIRRHFTNPDELLEGGDTLALASIDDSTEEGAALRREARDVLEALGKAEADSIGLADVEERMRALSELPFNGDGVITTEATEDANLRTLVGEIVATHGAVQDRSGHPGIDGEKLDAFFDEAAALDAWQREGEEQHCAQPLGDNTISAAKAAAAVREKMDDFFARLKLAQYDPHARAALSPAEDVYRTLAAHALSASAPGIAELPLAAVDPGRGLALGEGLNPAWADAVRTFRTAALDPVLGTHLDALEESDWRRVESALARCDGWLKSKPRTKLDELDIGRIREIVSSGARGRLRELIQRDADIAPQAARVGDLEKMLRFKRDFVHLVNNFVSFAEFYSRRGAIFEAGTLYLDGRSCDLTVRVDDAAKHAVLAGLAKTYLAYCDCTRGSEKMGIVSAFTAGDVDYLLVGRNGIFYDRKGQDWDATIAKVIESPISIRQAFFSPYKKFVRAIEEQIAKRAAASETKAQGGLASLATGVVNPDKAATNTTPPVPAKSGIDVGTVAALGVALGSISTVIVGVFAKFVDLGWWIPVALVGVVLAISGPSMLIAWLKLRQRSLAPILDASGWAINGHVKINVPLGRSLSREAHVPRGSERSLRDPYAESHGVAYAVVLLVLIAVSIYTAWRMDALDPYLSQPLQHKPPASGAALPGR